MTNKDKFGNPINLIVMDKDGIPCISLDEQKLIFVRFFNPRGFSEMQEDRENNNMKDILDELNKFFKGDL